MILVNVTFLQKCAQDIGGDYCEEGAHDRGGAGRTERGGVNGEVTQRGRSGRPRLPSWVRPWF